MRGHAVTRAVLVALIALAGTASADDRQKAETYFKAGERAYRAQKFAVAAHDFDAAYEAAPLPEIAFSAAQAHRRAYRVDQNPGDIARAMELYRVYLANVKSGGRVRDAADAISELTPDYERLAARGVLGQKAAAEVTQLGVSVSLADQNERQGMHEVEDKVGTPQIAIDVRIDDTQVDADALGPVTPGPHTIHVRAPGYVPVEKHVKVIPASRGMIEVELQPQAARVELTAEAGARVSVDGRRVGDAPLPALELPPGRHLLVVARDGRESAGRDLVVTRGQHLVLDVPLATTTRRRSVRYVAGGAIGAGVVCVASWVLALHYQHEAQQEYDRLKIGDQPHAVLSAYHDDLDMRGWTAGTAWTAGAIAVAGGVTAAWLYYFDRPADEGIRVAPTASAGGGGAVIAGHF